MAKMTNNPVRIQFVRHNFSEIQYKNLRFLITDRPTDANMEQYIAELKKFNCKVVVRVCEPTYKTDKLTENNIAVLDWQFPDGHGPPAHIVDNWFNLLQDTFYRRGQQQNAAAPINITSNVNNNNNNTPTPPAVTANAAAAVPHVPSSATSIVDSSPVNNNNNNNIAGSYDASNALANQNSANVTYSTGLQGDSQSVSGAASSVRPPSSPQSHSPCVAVHCVAGLGRAPVLVAIALMERGMKYEDAVDLIRQRRQGALNMKQLEYLRQYKRGKRLPRPPTGSGVTHSGSGSSNVSSGGLIHSNGVGGSEGEKQCNIL